MSITEIHLSDFIYDLPQQKIAMFPAEPRDSSRLLVYNPNNDFLAEDIFENVIEYLPHDSLLIFNETRVVHARMIFRKPTGGQIEVLCLNPVSPSSEIETAFQQTSPVIWKAYVGNAKRWKSGVLKMDFEYGNQHRGIFQVRQVGRKEGIFFLEFSWEPEELTFSEVLEAAGKIPLPPYIRRKAIPADDIRYQTVYARCDGSVAAPTAGLHFTEEILQHLPKKDIQPLNLILHIGAGTFKPVDQDDVRQHVMHTEEIIVKCETIERLLISPEKLRIVVGTTGVRTLESLYQTGKKLLQGIPLHRAVHTNQWDPYEGNLPETSMALETILDALDKEGQDAFRGTTSLMIVPGYQFKFTDILITNFHQPRSTLLMLVAAFCGNSWRKAYNYALDHQFRFLSYGDACLFFKNNVQLNGIAV
ncbi:MAG: S-adenosylmethionine:tRNA ribosyltransferase-isomerase [Bacteroidales bacterium]|nr:S-adenosylmethionine:tRNA ribosyltransferase-isomerase [Bacteroidales bacterium]